MKGYAVLLNPESPTSILELLSDYIRERGSFSFVFCDSVEPHGGYVELELVREERDPWKVSIPYSCVLAICDASGPKGEFGFLSNK